MAEGAKRIERLTPEFDRIIETSQPIQELADGFGGPQGPAEGPLWWHEGGHLVFSDIHNNRRMKYEPGRGVSLLLEPTNRANGLTRDLQGRLVACEHDSRRVTRQEADGSITVVANSFQGRQLNRPNDVVVKSDGCIYFTDPWTSPNAPNQWDLTFSGVYRVTPDLGTLSLLADDFIVPNGLAFSPDESVLYVNDSRRGHIRAFEVAPNGTLAKHSDRVFADLRGSELGRARRHEGRCRGQRLLRRSRRAMDHRPRRQETRPHRARRPGHHQPRLWGRRLENALFHQPQPSRRRQRQDRRRRGSGRTEITSAGASAGKETNRYLMSDDCHWASKRLPAPPR